MKSMAQVAKFQVRQFAKINKKGGPSKVDGVGLSTISEFWFGDKISVWDRVTCLTPEDHQDVMQRWFTSTPAFDKILKE